MTDLFLKFVTMSITASWLALAVIVLRLLLKKAPKWLNLILWGLVGLRLVLPFSIQSALSLIPSAKIRPELLSAQGPAASGGAPALSGAAAPAVSEAVLPTVPAADIIVPNPLAPDTAAAAADPMQTWLFIAAVIWAIGAAAMLAYALVSYLRISRRVKTAVRLRDNIYQSEHAVFPFVLGVFRPRIYLPFRMADTDTAYVIAHEQTHIKRKDHWTKPIGFLLLALYWFNPVLWAAYLLFCRDIEFACDERVVKELSEEQRADYSQALLVCSVPRRTLAACPLAFGEIGVKKRVKHILDYKKPSFWLIAAAVIVCIAAAVCFLTDPYSAQTEEEDGTAPPVESTEADETAEPAETVDVSKLAGMTPTSADMCGIYYGTYTYLYLPLNGSTYRYQHVTAAIPEDVTAGELLHTFAADEIQASLLETDGTGVSVYSVAEDPDYSRVLVDDGGEVWLYQYSPGTGAAPGALEQAIQDGSLVIESMTAISGWQSWLDFLEAAEAGTAASIQIAAYIPLSDSYSEEYREVFQEDYPILYIRSLTYDGSSYTLSWSSEGKEYEKTYPYLVRYIGDYPNAVLLSDEYVLIDDDTITWEELMQRMTSPKVGFDYGYSYTKLFSVQQDSGGAEDVRTAGMTPTSANLSGMYDDYLYISRYGNTYRYEYVCDDPEDLTAYAYLDSFWEEDTGTMWQIYSVKGDVEYSRVLATVGSPSYYYAFRLYQYSPSKAAGPDALEQAKENGCSVIIEDGGVTEGSEIWTDFVTAAEAGTKASVQAAWYLTLDPETRDEQYYEAYQEDYPKLYIYDLTYNGSLYTLSRTGGWDTDSDSTETYRYLKRYTSDDGVRYVLTNDDTLTWEDLIQNGLISDLEKRGGSCQVYIDYIDTE